MATSRSATSSQDSRSHFAKGANSAIASVSGCTHACASSELCARQRCYEQRKALEYLPHYPQNDLARRESSRCLPSPNISTEPLQKT